MEALERRAIALLIPIALLTFEALRAAPGQTWLLVFYLIGFACLASSGILLVAVVAPAEYIGRWDSERARLLFFAFALLVADVLVTLLIYAYEAYQTASGAFG